jgi:glycolate oxidase
MIREQDIAFFQSLLSDRCSLSTEHIEAYSHDETEDLRSKPGVVLFPNSTEEIAEIMKYCNANKISVTPSGARTGLSGGAIPIAGEVALSTVKLNKILKIDTDNLQVITEPGVITQVLQEEVAKYGLFYPPDPASKGSCFIGGNISENSGGPKAVKYGVTSDYVLNLEVVLPNGEIIWTGANTLKNATGYNLTQLMVGSEGTLGIIAKIVLRLIPHPKHDLLMLVPFFSSEEACAAVAAIFKAGFTPSGLEFMERDALIWAQRHLNDEQIIIGADHAAHLLIEVDGNDLDQLVKDCEGIAQVLESFETDEILFAESKAQKDALWKLRRSVGEAVKANSIYKEEDTVVPRFELPKLLKHVKTVGEKYGFESVCYGHAGDGNLHVNIIKGDLTDEQWNDELPKAISEIFERVVEMGGTISGEHGIGLVQKRYMPIAFSSTSLQIMKSIKEVFDPNGIMNPDKVI